MRLLTIIALVLTTFSLTLQAGPVHARDGAKEAKAARSLPVVRGGIVFKAYCTVCHGEIGDGVARATKLYGADSLIIRPMGAHEYEKIVRKGGIGVGRSEYMPPWEDELTEEQINDVVAYLSVVGDSIRRGEVVFKTNCILCHGVNGDGKGRVSVLYTPKPADLTASDKDTAYKMKIVSQGGPSVGRSPIMPPWGKQLSQRELEDVVTYIDTLVKKD